MAENTGFWFDDLLADAVAPAPMQQAPGTHPGMSAYGQAPTQAPYRAPQYGQPYSPPPGF